jgi:hypothetical protein
MVDADERGSTETQGHGERRAYGQPSKRKPQMKNENGERENTEKLSPDLLAAITKWLGQQEEPKRAKYKANSLRTQQAIARFGKSAGHPLCLAALDLWRMDAELSELSKGVVSREELLNCVKQQKREAGALYRQFCKEEKEKEACRVSVLLSKIGKHLLKVQECYQAAVKLRSIYQKWHGMAVARYEREHDAVIRAKDTKARRALDRVHKRWSGNPNAKGVRLKVDDQRTFEILKMLHDQAIKAAFFKDGAIGGYTEATFGGDRLLFDEFWQGRLTVRGIHSRLIALGGSRLAGDKDAKEIRRLLGKLGIRPAEDQLGRKWKSPYPVKQEPKRPRGRPRTKPEIDYTGKLDDVQRASLDHRVNTTGHVLKGEYGKLNSGNTSYGGLFSLVTSAQKDSAAIEREIKKLKLLSGGRKGKYVY